MLTSIIWALHLGQAGRANGAGGMGRANLAAHLFELSFEVGRDRAHDPNSGVRSPAPVLSPQRSPRPKGPKQHQGEPCPPAEAMNEARRLALAGFALAQYPLRQVIDGGARMLGHYFHRLIFVGAKSNASPIGKNEPLMKANLSDDVLGHFERPAVSGRHLERADDYRN